MIDELTILRIVAIKGRVSAEMVAGSLRADPEAVQAALDGFAERELVKSTPMGYRLTPAGRTRCAELVAAEHQSADASAVTAIYQTFCEHNTELKTIITDWQTRGPDEPNDHSDGEYDRAVLDRLVALHQQVLPLLDHVAEAAPRLSPYKNRLERAAAAVAAGDHTYVSRPILDSYHTVWFELHEDLIGLAGLTRAGEAEAGRGA
ncbi:MAG: MarR family transcriptional regulator [Mycobacterium sp.]